jgi:2-iminoacetate synthase
MTHMTDRELVQAVCAYRLMFPDLGLVLSTRESPKLRNGLMRLGITLMSAGSHTEPGGYTGAGQQNLHHTERGRQVDLTAAERDVAGAAVQATEQFHIADSRSAQEVADFIRQLGYEPVWKDWDAALVE